MIKKIKFNFLTKIHKFKIINYFFIGSIFLSISIGCEPADVLETDTPGFNSFNELIATSNFWCGYDIVSYPNAAGVLRLRTLFMINPISNGHIEINSVTTTAGTNLRKTFEYKCDVPVNKIMECENKSIFYEVQQNVLNTELLIELEPKIGLSRFIPCTTSELNRFRRFEFN